MVFKDAGLERVLSVCCSKIRSKMLADSSHWINKFVPFRFSYSVFL